jgi:hypothetical protein
MKLTIIHHRLYYAIQEYQDNLFQAINYFLDLKSVLEKFRASEFNIPSDVDTFVSPFDPRLKPRYRSELRPFDWGAVHLPPEESLNVVPLELQELVNADVEVEKTRLGLRDRLSGLMIEGALAHLN